MFEKINIWVYLIIFGYGVIFKINQNRLRKHYDNHLTKIESESQEDIDHSVYSYINSLAKIQERNQFDYFMFTLVALIIVTKSFS